MDNNIALSDLQSGMLFHSILKSKLPGIYNTQVNIDLFESINRIKLEEAWRFVIQKYEILRSYLSANHIVVKEKISFCLNTIDFRENENQDGAFVGIKNLLYNRNFNLGEPPLFDVTLAHLSNNHSVLIWTHHHIILSADAFLTILIDLFRFYDEKL